MGGSGQSGWDDLTRGPHLSGKEPLELYIQVGGEDGVGQGRGHHMFVVWGGESSNLPLLVVLGLK